MTPGVVITRQDPSRIQSSGMLTVACCCLNINNSKKVERFTVSDYSGKVLYRAELRRSLKCICFLGSSRFKLNLVMPKELSPKTNQDRPVCQIHHKTDFLSKESFYDMTIDGEIAGIFNRMIIRREYNAVCYQSCNSKNGENFRLKCGTVTYMHSLPFHIFNIEQSCHLSGYQAVGNIEFRDNEYKIVFPQTFPLHWRLQLIMASFLVEAEITGRIFS